LGGDSSLRISEVGSTQKGIVAGLLVLVVDGLLVLVVAGLLVRLPSVPSAGCLLSALLCIAPHVGKVRLVSMVPLMPIDVGLVVVLEHIVVGNLLDVLVPGTFLVSLADSMVALKSVDGLVS